MAAQEGGETEVNEPPPKPPDKNRTDREKQMLSNQIKNLEIQLRGCSTDENVDGRVQQLQTAREELRELHHQTDQKLQALAPRITETRHAIFKLRDKLKYRTEQQVDDAVVRLEKQVQTQNFKLKEEEKVVREINELKKSKRTLREYDAKKKELEALNQKQRGLRYERDRLYSEIDKNKREEDRIQREAQSMEANVAMLNGELRDLRDQRQALQDDYQQRLDAWQTWQRGPGARRPRPREDAARPPPPPQPAPSVVPRRQPPEPYRPELSTCANLISYLQRLSHTPGTTPATPSAHLVASGGSTPLSPGGPPAGAEGGHTEIPDADGGPTMFLLPRKQEPAPAAATSGRSKRRRDRRGSQRVRPLTHSSEIFHQFCQLDLQPPSTSKEVPAVLEQLKAKQKYFQMCALKAAQERSVRPPPAGDAGGRVPQLTLRLHSEPADDAQPLPPPPPPPDELVTLHSIGVQLPYQLTVAAPSCHYPPTSDGAWTAPAALPAEPAASRPSSRDSGVPSAPLSAEAADPERDPFAEALQSRLAADGGAAQRPPQAVEVPGGTPSGSIGAA